MSTHIELTVNINPLYSEYLSEFLITEIGCAGVVTEESTYKMDECLSHDVDRVKGYLWFDPENKPNFEAIQQQLWQEKHRLEEEFLSGQDTGSWNLQVKEIADEEWAHSWKKYWHTQKISDKIVINPSWEEYQPAEGELVISLDPGIAFGTGTHQTTRLCARALEKYMQPDMTVADIGTGSGILCIVAAKLGAKEIIGVDNDKSVISVAKENADINAVGENCIFYEGSATDVENTYDVVVANILAHVLIDMMADLEKLVRKGGYLILSGIINEKAEDVVTAVKANGLHHIETTIDGDWSAVIAQK